MTNHARLLKIIAAAISVLPSVASAQTVLVSFEGQSAYTAAGPPYYLGQSFTVAPAGAYNNVSFNFVADNAPFAANTLFIYTSPFTGTVSQLGAQNGSFIGSAAAVANHYTFSPAVLLFGGSTYYAYSNTYSPEIDAGVPSYNGGAALQANNYNEAFGEVTGADLLFKVTGSSIDIRGGAVPEPATWGMMLLGFGAAGYAMRRRAKVRTNVSFA